MAGRESSAMQGERFRATEWGTYDPVQRTGDKSTIPSEPGFVVYCKHAEAVFGPSPELTLVQRRQQKFAHEAGVYIASTGKNYFTSNYQDGGSVDIYGVDSTSLRVEQLDLPRHALANANGGCNLHGRVLFCAQGDLNHPSTLTAFDPKTNDCEVLLDNFCGRPFNSINDVVVHHQTGDLWFTDPTYGFQQGFRPRPQLPSQVYRFRPSTGQIWCVADGFVECNGLCFSHNFSRLYVTDTGAVRADGVYRNEFDPTRPSTIYVYDVVQDGTHLSNRRVFAFCTSGVPDGIKCDEHGNVYAGCGDGIHIWSPGGDFLGKIYTQTMVANFNFSPAGIWVLAEETLYLCKIQAKGALEAVEAGQ